MAQKKISELEQIVAPELKEESLFPLVQDGATRSIRYAELKTPMVNEVTADVSTYIDNQITETKNYIDSEVGKVWTDGINAFHSLSENKSSPESYVNIGNGGNTCRYLATPDKIKLTSWGQNNAQTYGLYINDENFKPSKIMILDAVLIFKKSTSTAENQVIKLAPITPSEVSNNNTDYWIFTDLISTSGKINGNLSVNNQVKYIYVDYLILY